MDYFNYSRRETSEVSVRNVIIGSNCPIRLQSMATVSTMDTNDCVEQAKKIIDAGGELVRFTTQGIREAENLGNIRRELDSQNYDTPIVADVHFNPKVAEVAVLYADKVRINPGNYVDPVKKFISLDYTEEEYKEELQKIKESFIPFIRKCRDNKKAIRIGVNHGSLSDRIMSRYGDTPKGMVESCMEFLRICKEENFNDVVISIKASNTVIMVLTVRLLVSEMEKEQMNYPLHLGVTEAGEGEDGRIKSAFGIGALLADGLGDTIRVSLSENPECEIPVGKKMVDYLTKRANHSPIHATVAEAYNYISPVRRKTHSVANIGGEQVPVVISNSGMMNEQDKSFKPDYIYASEFPEAIQDSSVSYIVDFPLWKEKKNVYPVFKIEELSFIKSCHSKIKFLILSFKDLNSEIITLLQSHPEIVVIATSSHINLIGDYRALMHTFINENITNPVIFSPCYHEEEEESLQIKSAMDMGALIIDGFCDGIYLSNSGSLSSTIVNRIAFGILQAGRTRVSKTEYISCPGCGRTLFDLQNTIARVKKETSHLKGLKIAIMGCIVNGPGEMADADYGYVGAGKGRVSLYKKKDCIEKNIPEEEAVSRLIELIKINGDF